MKYIVFVACMALAIISNAAGDEKILKQVSGFIAKGNFIKAAETLDKISDASHTKLNYLQAAALVYDSLKQYKKAIEVYTLLQKDAANNAEIATRLSLIKSELAAYEEAERIRLEKMKNCKKCTGTGALHTVVTCPLCGGGRQSVKECPRCKGDGKMTCSNCGGTGKVESSYMDRIVTIDCRRCGGEGSNPCNNMCNRGTVIEECRKCNATGEVRISTPCDLH